MSANETKIPAIRSVNGAYVLNTHVTSSLPPAEGRQRLRVEQLMLKESGSNSKNPGQPYISARFRVLDGPDDGKTIFNNLMLEGNFRFLFEQLAQACGLDGRDDVTFDDFEGQIIEAEVKHTDFNGQQRGEIKRIFIEAADPTAPVAAAGAAATKDYPF